MLQHEIKTSRIISDSVPQFLQIFNEIVLKIGIYLRNMRFLKQMANEERAKLIVTTL